MVSAIDAGVPHNSNTTTKGKGTSKLNFDRIVLLRYHSSLQRHTKWPQIKRHKSFDIIFWQRMISKNERIESWFRLQQTLKKMNWHIDILIVQFEFKSLLLRFTSRMKYLKNISYKLMHFNKKSSMRCCTLYISLSSMHFFCTRNAIIAYTQRGSRPHEFSSPNQR